MARIFGLTVFGLVLTLPALVTADGVVPGTWKLTVLSQIGKEQTNWLLKLENNDGKTTATLLSANPLLKAARLVSFTIADGQVRIVVESPAQAVFEGRLSPDGKRIAGVFGTDRAVSAAYMVPTELTKLEFKDVNTTVNIDEMNRAVQLTAAAAVLEAKARSTKDADERVDLVQEALEARNKAAALVPKLYRETITKHPQTVAAGQAALALLQQTAYKADPEEVKTWAEVASRSAGDFGARWRRGNQHANCCRPRGPKKYRPGCRIRLGR